MKFDKLALRTEIKARAGVLKTLRVQLTQPHTEDSPQLQYAQAFGALKVTILQMALAHSRGKLHGNWNTGTYKDLLGTCISLEDQESILKAYLAAPSWRRHDLDLNNYLATEEIEQTDETQLAA